LFFLHMFVVLLVAGCGQPSGLSYSVPGAEKVAIRRDLQYRGAENASHLLDVYLPAGNSPKGGHPSAILIHGSVTAKAHYKNTPQMVSWGRLLAASGVGAVTFNWDSPKSADVDAAIRYVRDHATGLGLDKRRVCLIAFSGGGSESIRVGLTDTSGTIRGVVSYYGDLRSVIPLLEPVSKTDIPPMLVALGQRDDIVPPSHTTGFVDAAKLKGALVTLLTHESGAHAFDLSQNARSREIVKQTVETVARWLKESPRK
jgi:predicted esterase